MRSKLLRKLHCVAAGRQDGTERGVKTLRGSLGEEKGHNKMMV